MVLKEITGFEVKSVVSD